MFGNLAEMAGLMKKAKDIQNNLKGMKDELANTEFCGTASGDKVQVVVAGDMRVKKVFIAPDAVEDVELLEDMVLVAVNNALDSAKQSAQQKMSEITGGINIPGLF
jgi:DNA-binding YbaB/EbfC family protein